MSRRYQRTVTTNAEPSRPPNFAQYKVRRECYGCGRKLVAKNEASLWFTGIPVKAVFGACCYTIAAQRRAA